MDYKHYKRLCDDIESVENYDKAKADDFRGWDCHHRLETHNSDGERRFVDISKAELISLDMYWHRPAKELIFLTKKEHRILHTNPMKGKKHSEEARKKMSEKRKGRTGPNKGKHFSEEWKKKIGESSKGRHLSEEAKRKIREANTGKVFSEEHKKKLSKTASERNKGRHWYNNGTEQVFRFECPEGFVFGRL